MTVVVDASALVDLLVWQDRAGLDRLADLLDDGHWVVPCHARLEVASALRGWWLARKLTDAQLRTTVDTLGRLDLDERPTSGLLPRIVDLAANATVYDAAYLALAEHLGCPLVTADAKLAAVPGSTARVLVAG